MKFRNIISIFIPFSLLLFFLFASTNIVSAQNPTFTLVIDAGHGGHDPGALGTVSREKDINLAVSLQLGALVEKNFKDVNVVFTRKTDKYLTLQERADVVNNNHADLFICVHTNSAKSSLAFGSETFTLGLAKSKANLDVAMRENSVILLEDDYKTKYKGFDPASVESYIMFEFMQDKYIDKSIDLASTIQKQFTNFACRSDRGVRQAGFWVLHRSACPSVLVELGFISNPSEEQFLTSESGQKDMATAIYNAFVNFKRNHDKKSGKQTGNQNYVEIIDRSTENLSAIPVDSETETIQPETAIETKTTTGVKATDSASISNTIVTAFNNTDVKPVFKVQLFACRVKLKPNASDFKGLKEVDYFVENDMYKYTIGVETEYNKIAKIRKEIIGKFPDAFIIAFVGDKKITAKEALKLTK